MVIRSEFRMGKYDDHREDEPPLLKYQDLIFNLLKLRLTECQNDQKQCVAVCQ